jgi:hypothetical protein
LFVRYAIWNFEQDHLSASTKAPFLFVVLLTLFKDSRILVKEYIALVMLLTVTLERHA